MELTQLESKRWLHTLQALDVPQYTQLIFGLMKIVDYGKPTMGKFYEYHDSLIERSHAMEEGFIRNVKKSCQYFK
jgi:hypothetical protein